MADKKDVTSNVSVERDDKGKSKEEVTHVPSATREVSVAGDDREEQRRQLLDAANKILAQYGNHESEIPLDSEYWSIMNKYRGLR